MRWMFLAVGVLIAAAVGLSAVWGDGPAVHQPIAFNHKVHLAQDLKCLDCHVWADKGLMAGFPPVKGCILCHREPKGAHPDEPLVRQYGEKGEDIPWVRVNRAPGHVYFSHKAHVKFGGFECEICHKGQSSLEEPVSRPLPGLVEMKACMACHEKHGKSTDCLVCHK